MECSNLPLILSFLAMVHLMMLYLLVEIHQSGLHYTALRGSKKRIQ